MCRATAGHSGSEPAVHFLKVAGFKLQDTRLKDLRYETYNLKPVRLM